MTGSPRAQIRSAAPSSNGAPSFVASGVGLAEALADPTTRFVLARGTGHLVRREPVPSIAFLDAADPLVRSADPASLVLLGWFEGARCVLVPSLEGPLPPGTELSELRPLLGLLPAGQSVVLACARALLVWQARHRHCGVCGAPTPPRAGHARVCTSTTCGTEFFPRIDPAVIVVVSYGDDVLLGRQPTWPPGGTRRWPGSSRPGRASKTRSRAKSQRRPVYAWMNRTISPRSPGPSRPR